ncbi:uncharacterized protein PGRI_065130 [Penicillium griseofulvum]|uniref:Uncharacterized protein n=1 Tax=Penicillium patulum TaxID=5078 RepID=A0A135LPQ6_PENPA|nr:uncharacterized protein PGRI_065130 [Penicillium griseofulvum]KXG50941.1 hypothetical protein PGRI_065130 [Penicillium griseofulvum]
MTQPPTLKEWPHMFNPRYVFRCLGIADRVDDQRALRNSAQLFYNIIADEARRRGIAPGNFFRSSAVPKIILNEWRERLPTLPLAVRNHVIDDDLLCGALYKYINNLQDELLSVYRAQQPETQQQADQRAKASVQAQGQQLQGQQQIAKQPTQPAQQTQGQQIAKQPTQPTQPARNSPLMLANPAESQQIFQYHRPFIVPNGDVQIIQANHPDMPIAIRLSDFLTDKGNPYDVCPDGDWINIANIRFELFKRNLIQEGYMADGDTVWIHHLSLDQIDHTLLANPQAGESRLTGLNLASTLLRTIREHWPRLRNPSPDPYRISRSPLPRPNLTIIIRGGNVKGGALSTAQPSLARPAGLLSGNLVTSNSRMEQMARYENIRHNTKRKRTAEAEAGEAGNETEEGSPAAQRRRKTVTPPAADPAASSDTAWQDLLMGDDEDAALQALLDPTMFNDQGFMGNNTAAMQTFFEGNQWAVESIEEDQEEQ